MALSDTLRMINDLLTGEKYISSPPGTISIYSMVALAVGLCGGVPDPGGKDIPRRVILLDIFILLLLLFVSRPPFIR